MKKQLFKIGDKVEIIKYGHLSWEYKKGKIVHSDMLPELLGQIGIVCEVSIVQKNIQYALERISKHAWYNEDQLKLTTS